MRPTRKLRDEQPPVPEAHACKLGLAPGGGCLAGRVATPPVVSYTTFSPLPGLRIGDRGWYIVFPQSIGGLFLWPCSAGHPAWVLPSTVLCGARTFLTLYLPRRGRPAPLGKPILARQFQNVNTRLNWLTFTNGCCIFAGGCAGTWRSPISKSPIIY